MEQLEILDLAMLGILRLMDNSTDAEEIEDLNAKLDALAMLYVLERDKEIL